MELNQFKRGLLSITTNAGSFHFPYQLPDVQVKRMETQKNIGVLVIITKHLKWNSHVLAACSKANRMLGFIRRSAFNTHDQRARKLLYLLLVRSNLTYCSQVWAKLVISRGFWKLGYYLYWYEFLDFVPVLKYLVSLSDLFISVMDSTRPMAHCLLQGYAGWIRLWPTPPPSPSH